MFKWMEKIRECLQEMKKARREWLEHQEDIQNRISDAHGKRRKTNDL